MSESTPRPPKRVLVAKEAGAASTLVGANVFPVLGVAGLALLAVGLADLALTWYPLSFGNREWEFGTVTATLNTVPVTLMGTVFVYLAATDLALARTTRFVGAMSILAALAIFAMLGLYLTNLPLALGAVDGPVLTGVKKAAVKSLVQGVVYPVTFGFIGWRALRHFRTRAEA